MSTYLFDGIENQFLPDGIEKIRFANNCYKTENGFIAKTVVFMAVNIQKKETPTLRGQGLSTDTIRRAVICSVRFRSPLHTHGYAQWPCQDHLGIYPSSCTSCKASRRTLFSPLQEHQHPQRHHARS